jgi:hypothetical protein
MAERKYGLARFVDTKRMDREVRRATSTDDENLEKRRLEYGRNELTLKAAIKRLQTLQAPEPPKPTDPDASQVILDAYNKQRAEYEKALEKYQHDKDQIFTLVNLSGIVGLYEGLGILADMSSIRERDKDPKTGDKVYYRLTLAEMLCDIAAFMEDLRDVTAQQAVIMEALAIKMGAGWEGRFTGKTRAEAEAEAVEAEAAAAQATPEMAPVGVTEQEIAAAANKPSEADVDQFLGKK